MIKGKDININGKGDTSRDFSYIKNVVEMNILSALSGINGSEVFNVAVGERTTLNELYSEIRKNLEKLGFSGIKEPVYGPYRKGDVLHSLADVSKAKNMGGYSASHSVKAGLSETMAWYAENTV